MKGTLSRMFRHCFERIYRECGLLHHLLECPALHEPVSQRRYSSILEQISCRCGHRDCKQWPRRYRFLVGRLPLDVAKTIIQTSPQRNSTRNPFLVLYSIYNRAGLKGCYVGIGPTIVRAFPANAAAIVTWELAIKVLGITHCCGPTFGKLFLEQPISIGCNQLFAIDFN